MRLLKIKTFLKVRLITIKTFKKVRLIKIKTVNKVWLIKIKTFKKVWLIFKKLFSPILIYSFRLRNYSAEWRHITMVVCPTVFQGCCDSFDLRSKVCYLNVNNDNKVPGHNVQKCTVSSCLFLSGIHYLFKPENNF